MPSRSLSHRVFLVAGTALLPAIAIILYGVVTLRHEAEDQLHAKAYRTAELASLEMERIVSGAENILRVLAAAPAIRDGDFDTCSKVIAEMAASVDFLASLAVINDDGYVRCLPETDDPTLFVGDRSYFQAALNMPGRVTGSFTIARQSGRRVLPIALRIGGTADAPPGVAVAYIDLDWLQQRLADRSFESGSSLNLVDRNGIILARVPDPDKYVGTPIPSDYLYLLNEPEPGTLELDGPDGTRRVLGYFPLMSNPAGVYVSAGYSKDSAYAPFKGIATRAVLLAAAGILASLLLASYTSRTFIARPVQKLVDTVDAWRSGDAAARTGMQASDGELGSAGVSFDGFIEELLESRAARQKSEDQRALMSDELEHRVKNLLAMIQVIARQTFPKEPNDLALQTFGKRLSAIGAANDILRNGQWTSASLRGLVQSAVSPFTDAGGQRVHLTGPDLPIKGNAAVALSMALHELCTNAVKYGAWSNAGGSVALTWGLHPSTEGETFVMTWVESGGPQVNRPGQTGFGSTMIQRTLAAQLEGKVDIEYRPSGLAFRLDAPAAGLIRR
jgi:two-component sensor histidine kinase